MTEHVKKQMITRKSYFHIILVIIFLLVFYSSSAISEKAKHLNDLAGWDKTTAIIQTHENEIIEFRVLIAQSNKQRRQGLMHIESMEEDQGMLFIFDPSRNVSMWMSNTPMTLDMLFIDKMGKSSILQRTPLPIQQRESLLGEALIGY